MVLSDSEVEVVRNALDLYARMCTGNMEEVVRVLAGMHQSVDYDALYDFLMCVKIHVLKIPKHESGPGSEEKMIAKAILGKLP